MARAGSIAFKQVLSWDVQGEGFFSEAWHAMRGHVSTFRASALGGDVIDPEVVSDGEVTDGGKSDGGRSDRSARSGTAKGKKRAAKDINPPAPPKKLAGKGNAAAPQKAALACVQDQGRLWPLWYVNCDPFFFLSILHAGQRPRLSALLRARTRAGVCCLCSHRPHRPQTVFENSIGLLCGACVLPVFWCAVTER